MKTTDYTLTLVTEQSPQKVFQAITNVRSWWSGFYSEEINGGTAKLNDEFTFRAAEGAHVCTMRLIEVIPGKKIVWLVTDSALSFLEKKDEWTGTKVIFEISKLDGKTQLAFTHQGLTPEVECYDSCAPAWSRYLQSRLLPLINGSAEPQITASQPNYSTI